MVNWEETLQLIDERQKLIEAIEKEKRKPKAYFAECPHHGQVIVIEKGYQIENGKLEVTMPCRFIMPNKK